MARLFGPIAAVDGQDVSRARQVVFACCRAATSCSSLNEGRPDQHQQQRRLRRHHCRARRSPSACAPASPTRSRSRWTSVTGPVGQLTIQRLGAAPPTAAARRRSPRRGPATRSRTASGGRRNARRRRVRSGFETRRRAERRQRAAGAVRLAREADAPAVPDQLVADPDPAAPAGSTCIRSFSMSFGSVLRVSAEAHRQPLHVRVDDDALGDAVGGAEHDVRGLARDAGQGGQLGDASAAPRRRSARAGPAAVPLRLFAFWRKKPVVRMIFSSAGSGAFAIACGVG